MIFFISDTHFWHSNIIKYCPDSRGQFVCVEDMNRHLVKQWNSKVGPRDKVYHLGDFGFCKISEWETLIDQLNGEIFLIPGNHDKKLVRIIKKQALVIPRLTVLSEYEEITVDKQLFVLSHYPILSWNKKFYGSIHLHGHCHATLTYDSMALDVGVDARPNNDLCLWSLDEIVDYINDRKFNGNYIFRNKKLTVMHDRHS